MQRDMAMQIAAALTQVVELLKTINVSLAAMVEPLPGLEPIKDDPWREPAPDAAPDVATQPVDEADGSAPTGEST